MRNDFQRRWLDSGASPLLVEKGLKLADEWTESQLWPAGEDENLKSQMRARVYDKAIKVADNWMIKATE